MRYCIANLQKMYRYERELRAERDRLLNRVIEEDIALASSKAVIRTAFRDKKNNISNKEFRVLVDKTVAQVKQSIPPEVIVPPVLSVAEKKAKADKLDEEARKFAQKFAKFMEKKKAEKKDAELDAFEKEVQEADAILYAKARAEGFNTERVMTDAELDALEKEIQESDAILYAKIKADEEKAEKEEKALKKKNRFASLKNFFRSEKKVESREDKGMKAG